ncbi:MAG TPA: histidine kinase [Methanophagales archaeon]|nr:histidine kinase [Methanophagales archaeon]
MDEEERYKRAKARVEELREFYEHLIVYVIVNIMLVAINLVTSPDTLWFYWITAFWGIGLIWHAIRVFGKFGKEWEEKKIEEIMEKEERK